MRFFLVLLLCACAGMSRRDALESSEVLDRTEVVPRAQVQHVLLGWSWLSSSYRRMGMQLDPRAQGRNETQAGELAQQLLARCRKGEPFEALMKEFSEDPGSASSGTAYPVEPQSRFVEPFKDLALRLKPGECGLVKSQFGWHVMRRVA